MACSQLCHRLSLAFLEPFVHVFYNLLIGFKLLIFVNVFDNGFVVRLLKAAIIFSGLRVFIMQQLGHAVNPADREVAAKVFLEGRWDRQVEPWTEVTECPERDRAIILDYELAHE